MVFYWMIGYDHGSGSRTTSNATIYEPVRAKDKAAAKRAGKRLFGTPPTTVEGPFREVAIRYGAGTSMIDEPDSRVAHRAY